ncbi:hypothetical protein FIBSPDRAFT_773474 [Athelia psychrophila]|uniref:Septin-type G domain-containing protein n=1 Tax=Athelia psychrophila TaxID=1759441 RepID=A0A166WEK7_9AGAM|nr:hypothetical protein FIBSPDRAFT_773474 [Fibularhizoctonia sp. CBS 109695]
MFSFRRRSSKKSLDDLDSPQLKSSPSLPRLPSEEGIPWPQDLVDVDNIGDGASPKGRPRGATKTSLQNGSGTPAIPFHKPFRGPSVDGEGNGETISSLYMSHPPSAFPKASNAPPSSVRQRRARIPPTFNIMVVGGRGTGKSSFLRLLLETADISPTATAEQRSAIENFLSAGTKPTQQIQTASVEICESKFDRVLFSVIDTPGLDFSEGRGLRMERQVATIINYIDKQYAETMSEESKVIRQGKGDQHIHLCVYLVDPASILPASTREAPASTTSRDKNASDDSAVDIQHAASQVDDGGPNRLTMSPAEIRAIRGLSARANVLPVIAHADSLTDDRLAAVKDAVRRGLQEAGYDFGVFGPAKAPAGTKKVNGNGHSNGRKEDEEDEDEDEDEESDEAESPVRPTRHVVKLRASRHGKIVRSQSRSRRDLRSMADVEDSANDETESIANFRFSANIIKKEDLSALLPFAIIMPEATSTRNRSKGRPMSILSASKDSMHSAAVDDVATEEGHAAPSKHIRNPTFDGPPDDLRGVFIRKFRWGTVDVLDPSHCDFAALRTAVLSTHLKALKIRTKEVLYERYRTEKLVSWKERKHNDPVETQRMLAALEI